MEVGGRRGRQCAVVQCTAGAGHGVVAMRGQAARGALSGCVCARRRHEGSSGRGHVQGAGTSRGSGDRAVRTHVAARVTQLGRGGVVDRRVANVCSAWRALPVPVVRAGRGEGLEGGMRCVCAYARGLRAWSQYRYADARTCERRVRASVTRSTRRGTLTRPSELGPCPDAREPLTRTCASGVVQRSTKFLSRVRHSLVRRLISPSARHRAPRSAACPVLCPRPAPRAAQPRATGPPAARFSARDTPRHSLPPAPPACGRPPRVPCGRARRQSTAWHCAGESAASLLRGRVCRPPAAARSHARAPRTRAAP